MRQIAALFILVILSIVGCSSSDDSGTSTTAEDATTEDAGSDEDTSGASTDAPPLPEGWFNFLTDEFTVPPGTEKYFCFATTLEEDWVIDRMEYYSQPVVHHFLLVKTLAPEPDGFADCPVLFRPTWLPIFVTGTEDASLEMPAGYAHRLKKGDQIMIQLHLLNSGIEDVTTKVSVRMRPDEDPDAQSVGIYAFGTNNVVLPAGEDTSLVNECEIDESKDVEIFAMFPHMHQLGRSISLEVKRPDSDWETVFEDTGFNFDQQEIYPTQLTLRTGDLTRTTCSYTNSTDELVTFGDSSFDEMCYLVTYVTSSSALDGCIDLTTPDSVDGTDGTDGADGADGSDGADGTDGPDGECGDDPPNSLGIGTACTKGGGECPSGTTCSVDQGDAPEGSPGFCLSIGTCQSTADCGGGSAVCCAPAQGGGVINICMPANCRPSDCALKP